MKKKEVRPEGTVEVRVFFKPEVHKCLKIYKRLTGCRSLSEATDRGMNQLFESVGLEYEQ